MEEEAYEAPEAQEEKDEGALQVNPPHLGDRNKASLSLQSSFAS